MSDERGNSGDYNSGYRNSGDYNSGNRNSGYCNSGDYNSGNRNSGNCNSGNYNSGNRNSGIFNTDEPKMRAFGRDCDMTYSEWLHSDSYIDFDIEVTRWVPERDMTGEEKAAHPGYSCTGGYLKTVGYKDAWAAWWVENPDKHDAVRRLPNFDAATFEEITGIRVDACLDEEAAIALLTARGRIVDGKVLS